jgi:hypothetical protein
MPVKGWKAVFKIYHTASGQDAEAFVAGDFLLKASSGKPD